MVLPWCRRGRTRWPLESLTRREAGLLRAPALGFQGPKMLRKPQCLWGGDRQRPQSLSSIPTGSRSGPFPSPVLLPWSASGPSPTWLCPCRMAGWRLQVTGTPWRVPGGEADAETPRPCGPALLDPEASGAGPTLSWPRSEPEARPLPPRALSPTPVNNATCLTELGLWWFGGWQEWVEDKKGLKTHSPRFGAQKGLPCWQEVSF